jgi:hypothetical protein
MEMGDDVENLVSEVGKSYQIGSLNVYSFLYFYTLLYSY